ncbi:MAG: hypothetical protein M1825_000224 [Sarcosagium campestre]|nr:MAG: hypothetical protein M1825_000224 [Sarcosagium campestre]
MLKPNSITGARVEELEKKEKACADIQKQHEDLLKFIANLRAQGASLGDLAQMSSSANEAQEHRSKPPPRAEGGASAKGHSVEEDRRKVEKKIMNLEARANALKNQGQKAREELEELKELFS